MSLAARLSPPVANYLQSRVLSFSNAPADPHLPSEDLLMAHVLPPRSQEIKLHLCPSQLIEYLPPPPAYVGPCAGI